MSKLVVVIAERTIDAVLAIIGKQPSIVGLFEIRCDVLDDTEFSLLPALINQVNRPLIFTLRSSQDGGCFDGGMPVRVSQLLKLASFQPDYLDVEWDVADAHLEEIARNYPQVKLIRSWHQVDDQVVSHQLLEQQLALMEHISVYGYKLVAKASNSLDSLCLLHWRSQVTIKKPLIAHCMGEDGVFSRILGVIVGNAWSYANSVNQSFIPNCPDVEAFLSIYQFLTLNTDSYIYALIGDPVTHSMGHVFHNQRLVQLKENAVYVKIRVQLGELVQCIGWMKKLPFAGVSVTMPLKQAVTRYCDDLTLLAERSQSVNTLKFLSNQVQGTNTDGGGAIDSLRKCKQIVWSSLHVVVLGLGGAASAIIDSLIQQAVISIDVVVRNLSAKQDQLQGYQSSDTQVVGVEWQDLASVEFAQNDHVLMINTVPSKKLVQKDVLAWLKNNPVDVWMNVDYTPVAEQLNDKIMTLGIKIVSGKEMFYRQAQKQLDYWLPIR